MDFDFFQELDLVRRLAVATLVGLLVGIERGWRERDSEGGMRTAGIRTFTLIGILGGVIGMIARSLKEPTGAGILLASSFLILSAAFAAFRMRENDESKNFGFTTVAAAMVTFALGVYAVLGDQNIAAAAGVAVMVILAIREQLHGLLSRITWNELRAAIILLAMTFLALPFIPDRSFGPFGGVNPRQVWLLAVVLAAVSFLGYVAVKMFGSKRGMLLSAAIGGLVSSTSVTVDAARHAQSNKSGCNLLGAGVALATASSLARMLGVIAVLNFAVAKLAAVPLVVAVLSALAIAALMIRGNGKKSKPVEISIKNPFSLQATLLLAAFLGAAIFLTEALSVWLGNAGALAAAFIGGAVSVDPATFSMAELGRDRISPMTAAAGLWLAALSNTLLKFGLAWSVGPREFRWPLIFSLLAPIAAGAAAATAMIVFSDGLGAASPPAN
ncbi:MAG TPA: DUF4010 domain-containing protein [Xanthobacteraceae bacterium]|nr:DUF4010 domain-containing protein [Xanthobacteraceae bacterium]